MDSIDNILERSAKNHHHICPRQVLGVRMGMLAGKILNIDLPQVDKRLITIVETDGCLTDGIAVVTNCWVGRRTMRIEDYGKVAATFIDSSNDRAIRIIPNLAARKRARIYAPAARSDWEAQLFGYQCMPDEELLITQCVSLNTPIEQIISRPGKKALCQMCGEEIINQREVIQDGITLCISCARGGYYSFILPSGKNQAVQCPTSLVDHK